MICQLNPPIYANILRFTKMSSIPNFILNNGVEIPALGCNYLDVWCLIYQLAFLYIYINLLTCSYFVSGHIPNEKMW